MSFKKYNLTDEQIRSLANVFYLEQGNVIGVKACASHACNYLEKWQSNKFNDPYECVLESKWWGSKDSVKKRMADNEATAEMIAATKDVINNGNRTLPSYVDEYDWIHDVASATNNGKAIDKYKLTDRSQYKKDVTKVTNQWGSVYTFYSFPDGVNGINDLFGYISKPANSEEVSTVNETETNAASISSIVEKAISWMEALAKDNTHGYDQAYRWGQKGDYDCSSAVITAWETAGVKVKSAGATYTGDMYSIFKKLGFTDVTSKVNLSTGSGLVRGDVLLNHQKHVAMYCGNGKEVEASVNEKGTATGGTPGDQTGKEILIRSYRNYPWNAILRYGNGSVSTTSTGSSTASSNSASTVQNKTTFKLQSVTNGSTGASVVILQALLYALGYVGSNGFELEIDGECGANTIYALKSFQTAAGLESDGECGLKTWAKLKEGMKT